MTGILYNILTEICPRGKIKTAEPVTVERFSLAEKGGFELPSVCASVPKNALFCGLFGFDHVVCPSDTDLF